MDAQYEIKWRHSPNYKTGRYGRKIIAIVDHITAGFFPGCLGWLCNPSSKASAHYLITKTGEIYQLVKDEDTAYHVGVVQRPSWSLYDGTNPNLSTIGIEHEGYPWHPFPEKQYQATLWLHKQLIEKWKIPVDKEHIIGHYRIDSVNRPNCPGPNFPWKRLFEDLRKWKQQEGEFMDVKVIVHGKEITGKLIDGKTYVHIRDIIDALNNTVLWDEKEKIVIVK